ncbi:MAG: peptidoglycan-binding domain-containing protein [Patescibacteria group bacterium]
MFKRVLLGMAGLVLLVVPAVSSAQSTSCPVLTRMLTVGSEGEDVRALQRFLVNEGELLSGNASGYFGTLTEQGVKSWQWSKGIVTSQNDAGFGIVGPKTRAAITAVCKNTSSASGGGMALPYFTPSSTASPQTTLENPTGKCTSQAPRTLCATSWQGKRGTDGCVVSWYCVAVSSRNFTTYSTTLSFGTSTATTTVNRASCVTSGGVTVPHGQTHIDQTIRYVCANGQWYVQSTVSSTATTTSTNTSTTATSTAGVGSQFTYWCANGVGGLGYWSQTTCPSSTSTGGTYGSSANVQVGTLCGPEGRQEFIACPYMQNCFQGGTYLICKNAVWTPFY